MWPTVFYACVSWEILLLFRGTASPGVWESEKPAGERQAANTQSIRTHLAGIPYRLKDPPTDIIPCLSEACKTERS